jgi:hypothetical protein
MGMLAARFETRWQRLGSNLRGGDVMSHFADLAGSQPVNDRSGRRILNERMHLDAPLCGVQVMRMAARRRVG